MIWVNSHFSLDGPISAKNMFGHLKELMCGERWYSKTFPHKSKGIKGIEPDSNPKRSPLMEKLVFIFNPTLLKPIWYETTLYCLLESAWTVCENLNRHCYWFAEKRCHTKPLLTSSPFKPKLFLLKKRRTFFNDLFTYSLLRINFKPTTHCYGRNHWQLMHDIFFYSSLFCDMIPDFSIVFYFSLFPVLF